MQLILIYVIFFMGFVGGGLIEYKIFPVHFKLIIELCVYGLLLYSVVISAKKRQPYRVPFLSFWLLLLFAASISALINGYFNIKSVSSMRFMFRYYIFYIALVNLDLNDEVLRKINRFILFLLIIQLPVIAYKFTIFGVSERTIGMYAARGGGLTTMIPIAVVSFLFSYYYFYIRSKWLIIAALCFIAWGIIGAKAALFFLFPINFLGLYYLLEIRPKGFYLARNMINLSVLGILVIFVMGLFLYSQPRMNPDREVGGTVDFVYAFEFAKRYETATSYEDERIGTGRTSTTILAVKQLINDGLTNFLFGYGPGILTPTPYGSGKSFDPRVYFIASSYGITGLIYIWVEYGLFGAAIFSLIFIGFSKSCWRWYKRERDPYWKAFSTGALIFSLLNLLIFLSYNRLPIADDTLLPVFYYTMAIAFLRNSELNRST